MPDFCLICHLYSDLRSNVHTTASARVLTGRNYGDRRLQENDSWYLRLRRLECGRQRNLTKTRCAMTELPEPGRRGITKRMPAKIRCGEKHKSPDDVSVVLISTIRACQKSGDIAGVSAGFRSVRQRKRLRRLNGGRTVFQTGGTLLEK